MRLLFDFLRYLAAFTGRLLGLFPKMLCKMHEARSTAGRIICRRQRAARPTFTGAREAAASCVLSGDSRLLGLRHGRGRCGRRRAMRW